MSRKPAAQPPRVPGKRPGKPGGKRDANRREKVSRIADAALFLFLKSGIEAVTIDQIVDRAAVPKGSFYRYFTDKTDLCETIVAPLREKTTAAMLRCARGIESAGSVNQMAPVYLRLAQELGDALTGHPLVVKLYLQECRGPAVGARAPLRRLGDELSRQAIALSLAARKHGFLRSGIDPRVAALTVIGAAERLLFAQASGENLGPPERVPPALVTVILNGVLAGPREQ